MSETDLSNRPQVVNLIRKSGDLVSLTVVTVALSPTNGEAANPGSPAAASQPRQYASTLPRKLQVHVALRPVLKNNTIRGNWQILFFYFCGQHLYFPFSTPKQ
jgi:hypothetical protein